MAQYKNTSRTLDSSQKEHRKRNRAACALVKMKTDRFFLVTEYLRAIAQWPLSPTENQLTLSLLADVPRARRAKKIYDDGEIGQTKPISG